MKNDLKKLQGTWHVASLEVEGQTMPAAMLSQSSIVIEGDKFTTNGMGAAYSGKVEVDESTTPPGFNLHFETGPEKGNTSYGIYKLAAGTWTICLTLRGSVRPTKFASEPGSGYALETLTRGKSPAPKEETVLETTDEFSGTWAMLSGSIDGKPLDPAFVSTGRRIVRGDSLTVSFGGQVFMKVRYTVDRSQQPKTMDYLLNTGKAQYGVFAFQNETLRLAFAAPGKDRPIDFSTTPGDGRTVTSWRRIE